MSSETIFSKSYHELILLPTLKERFEYLKLPGRVGESTFGHDRFMNQLLYSSPEWRSFRNKPIIRDNGCEMAIPMQYIRDLIIVHHINPLTVEDVMNNSYKIYDMDNVVCVSPRVHRAIHFGDFRLLPQEYIPRTPNDHIEWKPIGSLE